MIEVNFDTKSTQIKFVLQFEEYVGSTYISDICKLRYKYPIWKLKWVAVAAAVGEVDLLGGDDEVPPDGGEVDRDAGEAAGLLTLTTSHSCFRSPRSLL